MSERKTPGSPGSPIITQPGAFSRLTSGRAGSPTLYGTPNPLRRTPGVQGSPVKVAHFDWFVDTVDGSDTNHGKTVSAAVKNWHALEPKPVKKGDRIGIKRGSTVPVATMYADNLYIDAYGDTGSAPVIQSVDNNGFSAPTITENVTQGSGDNDMILVKTVAQFDSDTTNGTVKGYDSDNIVVHLSDGIYRAAWDGSEWKYFYGTHPVTRPVSGDFSWVNQGGASLSTATGAPSMTIDSVSGSSVRARVKSAPATPYTITAAFLWTYRPVNTNDPSFGLCFRQSSDGKLHTHTIYAPVAGISLYSQHWNTPTSFNANVTNWDQHHFFVGPVVWLRIKDDGTNRRLYTSFDGINWLEFASEGRTTFLTADQIGWWANSGNNNHFVTLLHWKQE